MEFLSAVGVKRVDVSQFLRDHINFTMKSSTKVLESPKVISAVSTPTTPYSAESFWTWLLLVVQDANFNLRQIAETCQVYKILLIECTTEPLEAERETAG